MLLKWVKLAAIRNGEQAITDDERLLETKGDLPVNVFAPNERPDSSD
jgi:hypothetical protein